MARTAGTVKPTRIQPSSTAAKQPEPQTEAKAKPFFPYARYTSLVGVHASLLAFTAIFLPRSAFADLASPAQAAANRRDAMIMLTEAPARTVAWMCLGCVVLQWWWASWLREWHLQASVNMLPLADDDVSEEAQTEKAARKLRQQDWDSQKPAVLAKASMTTLATSIVFHIIIVLFGAPLTSHPIQTYTLSLLISLLTVWVPSYALGPPSLKSGSEHLVRRLAWIRLFAELSPRTPIERALVYPAVGAIIGCWTGVIPIGLDWERPWQAWPLTPAWGALGGYILGSMWALVITNFKHIVDLGVSAKSEDGKAARPSNKKAKKKSS